MDAEEHYLTNDLALAHIGHLLGLIGWIGFGLYAAIFHSAGFLGFVGGTAASLIGYAVLVSARFGATKSNGICALTDGVGLGSRWAPLITAVPRAGAAGAVARTAHDVDVLNANGQPAGVALSRLLT